MIDKLYHYAHSIEVRFFQLSELPFLPGIGKDFRKHVWKQPANTEDWVNLARFVDPREHVLLVDIGANVGKFTEDFLSVYRSSRAICIEPVSTTMEHIKRRFSGDERVQAIRCAISDTDGVVDISVEKDSTLSSLATYTENVNDYRGTESKNFEQTPCHRLDSLSIQKTDGPIFVKIDVQGFEVEAIRGGMKTLAAADAVLLECSFADEYEGKEPSFSPCCAMLRECGLYPIVFQDYGRTVSNYAYERDVLFVKRELLRKIYRSNYPQARAS